MKIRYGLAITLCAAAALLGGRAADAGQSVTIPAGGTTSAVPAYVARPAEVALAPGVVVLPGCEGLDKHYTDIADWLASKGYVAVAIDSVSPMGIKNACRATDGSRVEADDARATLAWMRSQTYIDPTKLAILGYSMGSIAALDVMDSRAIAAAPAGLLATVAYYPNCSSRSADAVRVPLRILDGDNDDWTPASPCQLLADDAKDAGKTVAITTYPGAMHAFNLPGPDRVAFGHHLSYDAAATTDAQAQTLTFLRQYLGATP
jgi:dienelactone hydrolase